MSEPTDTITHSDVDDIATGATGAAEAPSELTEELLVEEISIDGMCGVY